MKIYSGIAAAQGQLVASALALGNFDGVHVGHQQLFTEAIQRARARSAPAAALTFDPHPAKVLSPGLGPPLICSLERRMELMAAAGLDAAVVQPFDRDFAARSPDDFLARDLFGALAPHDIVVGPDFTFGRSRAGTVESLRLQCAERGVSLVVARPVDVEGLVVSSTKIRELVLEGRVSAAARLLGRLFDISGVVVRGAGRGQTIGFPTANVEPRCELIPGIGVYAVRAFLEGGRVFGGAANIGRKPTFGGGPLTVEVHLFNFEGDLYGQRIAVEFLEQLRAEQRFPSVEALGRQIKLDVGAARRVLDGAQPPDRWSPKV